MKVLYLVQNKIGKVEEGELGWCEGTMMSLELGGNRIRVGILHCCIEGELRADWTGPGD